MMQCIAVLHHNHHSTQHSKCDGLDEVDECIWQTPTKIQNNKNQTNLSLKTQTSKLESQCRL